MCQVPILLISLGDYNNRHVQTTLLFHKYERHELRVTAKDRIRPLRTVEVQVLHRYMEVT